MKSILPPHCSNCGAEADGFDSYSDCCNEGVVINAYQDIYGEWQSGKYYPHGTNAESVLKTCENQGLCYHD